MKRLGLWMFALALATSAQSSFESEEHGFRVERPDSWTFEEGSEAGSSFVLNIRPRNDPGTTQAAVKVRPALPDETAGDVVDEALQRTAGKREYSRVRTHADELDGRDAPGISVRYEQGGEVYEIHQSFLVANGLRYTIQLHAPFDRYRKHEKHFDAILDSFELLPASKERLAERRRKGLAARCGSEVEWAESWEEAAERARAEKRLVLVLVWNLSGFDITDSARTVTFMDPDVVELVNERFVLLRLEQHMHAPFVSLASDYGMGGSTFGQALLVATPDGEVVHDTSHLHPQAAFLFLLEALRRSPEHPGAKAPEEATPLERAARHLRRGELQAAAELLEPETSPEARVLRASLQRRLGRGGDALKELAKARPEADDELAVEIALDRAEVLLRLGRDREARDALDRLDRLEDEPEAIFWRGVIAQRSADAEAAREHWDRLIDARADSRWAWKAAAVLESTSLRLGGTLRTEWLPEDVVDSLREPAPGPLKVSEARRAETEAVHYLLSTQRSDGSWIASSEARSFRDDHPDPFVDAITAICGLSMLQRRADPACAASAKRAVEVLVASHARARRVGERAWFMDYTPWSSAWVLWFFADCIEAGIGDGTALRETMDDLIASLAKKQKENGGWSYYLTRDLDDGGAPANQSISFVSAAVTLGLLRAEEAGVGVPKKLREAALDCLEAMKNPAGSFEYMLYVGAEAGGRDVVGAAGRGPLCELALLRGGRGSLDALRDALDVFMEHRHLLSKELGKALMHAGPGGLGCHYLLFDYALAAAAVSELPERERKRHRAHLLELILEARSEEGGFLDTPINGWAYGTGMALLGLRDLEPLP